MRWIARAWKWWAAWEITTAQFLIIIAVLMGAIGFGLWRAGAFKSNYEWVPVLPPDFAVGQRVRNTVDNYSGVVMEIQGRLFKVRQYRPGYGQADDYRDHWWPPEALFNGEEIPQVDATEIAAWATSRPQGETGD